MKKSFLKTFCTFKSKFLLTIAISFTASFAMAQAPAFPGAEGTARLTTTGGRGGKIIHVTNLNDSGNGSLRSACEASGARIVVFDVSGTIELQSKLVIKNPNITIEGQTAPGDGICVKNFSFNISASNVIIRFIRCRMGDEKQTEDDAMNCFAASGYNNIIIDHCSISWSTDECGTFYGIKNFTLQWCILSESLRNSVHDKGKHGYGGIWGGTNAVFHHNLLAHHDSRNARIDHDYVSRLKGPVEMINNVIYNFGDNSTYGGESSSKYGTDYKKYNIINNYYKPGPATPSKRLNRILNPSTNCDYCNGTKENASYTVIPGHFYLSGNVMHNNSNVSNNNWNGVEFGNDVSNATAMKEQIKSETRFATEDNLDNPVTIHTANKAFDKVVDYAGASYNRDEVDVRIAKEAKEGNATYMTGGNGSTGGLIDTQATVGGWPNLVDTGKWQDTDKDGIPDKWEAANGLNPNDPNDAATSTIDTKGWYTNIEVYCNSIVEDIVKAENADAETAIEEYYPTYTSVTFTDEDKASSNTQETDVEYILSQSTYNSEGSTTSKWLFNDGIDISSSREYAAGLNNGIKYAANVKYTINLPEDVGINTISFDGYDNYGDGDSYLYELNGTTYSSTDYVFPKAPDKSNNQYDVRSYTIPFTTPATDAITFTFKGKQTVLIITLNGKKTTSSGISTIPTSAITTTEYYDLNGRRLAEPQRGVNIRVERMANGQAVTSKVIK